MGDTIWEWRACLLAGLAGRRRCNCSLQPVVLTNKRYQCMRTETSSDQLWDKGLDGVVDLAAMKVMVSRHWAQLYYQGAHQRSCCSQRCNTTFGGLVRMFELRSLWLPESWDYCVADFGSGTERWQRSLLY